MKIASAEQPRIKQIEPLDSLAVAIYEQALCDLKDAHKTIAGKRKPPRRYAFYAVDAYVWLTEPAGQARRIYETMVSDSAPEYSKVAKRVKATYSDTAALCRKIASRYVHIDPMDIAIASKTINPDWLNMPELIIALGWSRVRIQTAIVRSGFPAWKAVADYKGAKKQWRLYFDVYEVLEWLEGEEEQNA